MYILKSTDKRTGITYVYECESHWDKEKKQPRCHRKLIGKIDKETGGIIPTDGRCKSRSKEAVAKAAEESRKRSKREAKAKEEAEVALARSIKRTFCGATWLLDGIAKRTGVWEDLRECFPKDYKSILSIAYFLILEEGDALSRFGAWSQTHGHPAGHDIPSQRSSELFQRVTEDAKMRFFAMRMRRAQDDGYLFYDSTSISSYSQNLRWAAYGHNKDGEPLPQLNLLLLYGQKSNLPCYYRKLSGNIPDVKTVMTLLGELEPLGVRKPKLLMDRGFFSKANVDGLYDNHCKFLIACNKSHDFVKEAIARVRDGIADIRNFDRRHCVCATTEVIDWMHERRSEAGTAPVISAKRAWLHIYFNESWAADERLGLFSNVTECQDELKAGIDTQSAYAKCLTVRKTAQGVQVSPKYGLIKDKQKGYGFFALLGNEAMDAQEALTLYRNRDEVEKAFSNLKDRLNCNRLLVSSEQALEGKLFVHFVALILLGYIKKKMNENELFPKYTMNALLRKLDTIELLRIPGHKPVLNEILSEQTDLYKIMEIEPPDPRQI